MRSQCLLFPFWIYLITCSGSLSAQAQLGLQLDNYAGIHSSLLNPALTVSSPFRWDINLISFAVFFENSYAYLENASIFELKHVADIRTRPQLLENPESMPDNPLILNYYTSKQKKWASGLLTVMGPSILYKPEESDWAFGLLTQFRMLGQVRKLPINLDYYPYDATQRDQTISATPFKGAMMAWGEMGFNASRQIEPGYGLMTYGATFKILGGMEAAYGSLNDDFIITKRGTDTLQLENINAAFGFTTSNADIYNNSTPMRNINGYGAGMDIGVQFVKDGLSEKYQWRVGAALVDVGAIAFGKDARSYRIVKEDMFRLAYSSYEELTNPLDVATVLSEEALGDATAAADKNHFTIWLPAALHLHGDYAFTNNIYIGAAFLQRMPLGRHRVDRNNVLALAPRFEHRWFALVMPVNLLNYEQLHFGLAARLGLLTIGTDNLVSFVERDQFTGTDFYFALKLNPFNLKGSVGGNKKGQVRCYSF
jgi:Family of unknown function (DUF5723)